jgi:hypothetical protein
MTGTAVVDNVETYGDSDGPFMSYGSSTTTNILICRNCRFHSRYDAFNMTSAGSTATNGSAYLYNCTMDFLGPSTVSGAIYRGISCDAGSIYAYNCTISFPKGGTQGKEGIRIGGGGTRATGYFQNISISNDLSGLAVNSTNADVVLNAGAANAKSGITLVNVYRYDGTALSNNINAAGIATLAPTFGTSLVGGLQVGSATNTNAFTYAAFNWVEGSTNLYTNLSGRNMAVFGAARATGGTTGIGYEALYINGTPAATCCSAGVAASGTIVFTNTFYFMISNSAVFGFSNLSTGNGSAALITSASSGYEVH